MVDKNAIELARPDEQQPAVAEVARRADVLKYAAELTDDLVGEFGAYYVIEETAEGGKTRQRLTRSRDEAAAARAAGKHVYKQFAAPALARLGFIVGVSAAPETITPSFEVVGDYLVQRFVAPGATVTLWLDRATLTAKRADAMVAVVGPNGTEYGVGTTHISERAFASEHAFIATALTRAYTNAVAKAVGGRNRPAEFSEEEMLLSSVRSPAELVMLARRLGISQDQLLQVAGVSKVADITPHAVKDIARRLLGGAYEQKEAQETSSP